MVKENVGGIQLVLFDSKADTTGKRVQHWPGDIYKGRGRQRQPGNRTTYVFEMGQDTGSFNRRERRDHITSVLTEGGNLRLENKTGASTSSTCYQSGYLLRHDVEWKEQPVNYRNSVRYLFKLKKCKIVTSVLLQEGQNTLMAIIHISFRMVDPFKGQQGTGVGEMRRAVGI